MLERQEPQAIWTRRAAIMTTARLVVGLGAAIPLARYGVDQQAKIKDAASRAEAANPYPEPPVASPSLVTVAREVDNLYAQRKAIENEPRHIPWSGENAELIEALDKDKARRIAAVDEGISALRSSPEYQDHANKKVDYKQQVIEVAKARSEEAARLEGGAGVNWLSKNVAPIATLGLFLFPFLSAFTPNIFGRPSFPLRDTYREPPQTEANTTEVSKQNG